MGPGGGLKEARLLKANAATCTRVGHVAPRATTGIAGKGNFKQYVHQA